jgi:hypothetical protein
VVREFLREIGSRGGKAQSIEDKRAAVNKRWAAYRARQKPKTP